MLLIKAFVVGLLAVPVGLAAQENAPAPVAPIAAAPVVLPAGTHIPLTLINSVSTKHSAVGDRVYLQTAFPIMSGGKIVVPPGSYVLGTVTELKRPGRVRGRGELFLRFDSLTLPNGVVREFGARLSNVDATGDNTVDHTEGKVKAGGNVGGDLRTVGEAAGAGAGLGAVIGSSQGHAGLGAGAGAGAGALAGLLGVLLTRGPDAMLQQGTTVEMVLDRQLAFDAGELTFDTLQPVHVSGTVAPADRNAGRRRLPF